MLEVCDANGNTWHATSGGAIAGLVEDRSYQLRICGEGHALIVDDVRLSPAADGGRFLWHPGFFAGQVLAEILDESGRVLETVSLDVGPSPDKLGAPIFKRMVDELLLFRPELLLGTEAARSPFGHEGAFTNPEIEYVRLRAFCSAFVRAMHGISTAPITRLRVDRRAAMPHQARRIDRAAARDLGRNPAVAVILGCEGAHGDGICRISTPVTEETVDNPANRLLSAMLNRVLARTSRVARSFESAGADPQNPIAAKVGRRLQLLQGWRQDLLRLRRSRTFSAVTRSEITAAGLNAISAQPAYARAFQLAWMALRSGVHGIDAADFLPVSPTWEIYERWCFLQVSSALERAYPTVQWKLKVGSSVDAIQVIGVVGDARIVVALQMRFRAWDVDGKSPFRSLSGERAPDIVVSFESASGRRFLVLDAKYRSSRANVLDAMVSAHLYRDSLLWGSLRPWKSLLLIPRQEGAAWLGGRDFQEQFGVGALQVASSDDMEPLEALLTSFIRG